MTDILWNNDQPVTDFDIDVPAWIEQDITCTDIAAINQGGCESGAYMPAVTYWQANDIMAEHGDDVLEYIENNIGELPEVTGESWKGMAVKYLSFAVELWSASIEDELRDAIEESQELDEE